MKTKLQQHPASEVVKTVPAVRRVLVVDDELAIQFAYRKLLEHDDIIVDSSGSLVEAMDMICCRNYCAVIADMRLAGTANTDGLNILRAINEMQTGTRVILVTGCGSKELKQKAFEMGAAHYFEKPIMAMDILAALNDNE